jgi:hypothetical protein
VGYCNHCGSQLVDDYCENCNLYFIDPSENKISISPDQENIEIEKLLEEKQNIKKREKISIMLIIIGIILASSGSILGNMRIPIWITGALIMSIGLYSLLKSYSNTAEAEVQIRTIEAQKNRRVRRSNTYLMGDLFEAYSANLFPTRDFTFLEVTPRRNDLNDRYIEAALRPDFRIRYEPNGHIIWVECKYRSKLYNGKLKWCDEEQFERYKRFQKESRPEKVYVVIGLGGQPDAPDSTFCMPLDDVPSSTLEPSFYELYVMHPVGYPFYYQGCRLRWQATIKSSEKEGQGSI